MDAEGNEKIRFRPVAAWETPASIDELCKAYNEAKGEADSLLLTMMFILDFLCIHPFNDGNGRMSRLLTLLLLYQSGFIVGKYISIEKIIEGSKETYYEVLQDSSINWHENENDYKGDKERRVYFDAKAKVHLKEYIDNRTDSEPFWNVDTAFGLSVKKDFVLPRYLYYFCKKFDFGKLNKTVTVPSLTKSDLLKIKINVPVKEEQQAIIDKLMKIESIMAFRKIELDYLDVLIKARFVEMFGNARENPKGYKMVLFNDIVEYMGDIGSNGANKVRHKAGL